VATSAAMNATPILPSAIVPKQLAKPKKKQPKKKGRSKTNQGEGQRQGAGDDAECGPYPKRIGRFDFPPTTDLLRRSEWNDNRGRR